MTWVSTKRNNWRTGAIKSHLGKDSFRSFHYIKPYNKRIDNLRMPLSYQPPKFQQFDRKDDPKQHIAHFIETCNNAGTDGHLLVKQFARSLKRIAFDWYTNLDSEFVNSWSCMENEFLNSYFTSFTSPNLRSQSFQRLVTRAHNMDIKINDRYMNRSSSFKASDDKDYINVDACILTISKEAMVVNTITRLVKFSPKPKNSSHDRPTMKKLHAKKYPLLKPKRPDQVNKTTDPNYCRYHMMVSHPIEKC
ncbi:hypothetical protein RND81_03G004100, partial [Saponaria officinalis]